MSNGYTGSGFDWDWDEMYPDEYSQQSPYQSFFNQYLGEGVDIYNPESIAKGLMDKYDIEGLTGSMFTPMSKSLMDASDPSSYDAYRQMKTNPQLRQSQSEVAKGAGVLNPNKRRKRAKRQYLMGVGGISEDIYGRTRMASSQIKDWMKNALDKVYRMRF